MPHRDPITHLKIPETISQLQLANGGFPHQIGAAARTDSTAWAVMALSTLDSYKFISEQGREYLQKEQDTMGRVCISQNHPETSWPTPLAILAWHSSLNYRQTENLSSHFLLNFTGYHFKQPNPSAKSHDPAIRGWPWIADTHSWVIPTSMAILALKILGLGTHERVAEGKTMILDRQLPHGGWNYGNTFVFEKELHPLPECTGIALQALANDTHPTSVERSLEYLLKELPTLRTPISLGWALLGLGAWGLRPSNAEDLISASLDLQQRYGPYSVPSLALLFCASNAPDGLPSLFELPHSPTTLLPNLESFA